MLNLTKGQSEFSFESWSCDTNEIVIDVMGNRMTYSQLCENHYNGIYNNWQRKFFSGYYEKNPIPCK